MLGQPTELNWQLGVYRSNPWEGEQTEALPRGGGVRAVAALVLLSAGTWAKWANFCRALVN